MDSLVFVLHIWVANEDWWRVSCIFCGLKKVSIIMRRQCGWWHMTRLALCPALTLLHPSVCHHVSVRGVNFLSLVRPWEGENNVCLCKNVNGAMDQYIECIVSRTYCATIINPTSGSKKFSLYLPVTILRSSEKLQQIVTRFSDLGFGWDWARVSQGSPQYGCPRPLLTHTQWCHAPLSVQHHIV